MKMLWEKLKGLRWLRLSYYRMLDLLRKLWACLCCLCPIVPNRVVFVSYYGKGFGDSGKAIAQELLKRAPEAELIWAADKAYKDTIPAPIRFVEYRSLRYYYYMETARIWVDNSRKRRDVVKRRGQFYLQTWHGSVGLKKVEKDAQEHLSRAYLKNAVQDSKIADLFITNCQWGMELYQTAFWYDGEILRCGTPRMDTAINANQAVCKKVFDSLNIPWGKRILLYAPTFRNSHEVGCYNLDYSRLLTALQKRFGGQWAIAVRLHPNMAEKSDYVSAYGKNVVNATNYPDMYELLAAADALITDYSSSMMDMSGTKKPVFLFALDVEDYMEERGVYFRFDELPFTMSRSNDDLIKTIEAFDYNKYRSKLDEFHKRLGYEEPGTASTAIAKRLCRIMGVESRNADCNIK